MANATFVNEVSPEYGIERAFRSIMEETGIVTRVSPGGAEVEIDPSNACGQCQSKSVCHLDENGVKRTLKVQSGVRVGVGDLVRVEMDPGRAVFSAFLIFIFPLFCLGIGYFLGSRVSEGWGIVAAFLGLGGGFLLLRFIDVRVGTKGSFQPRITRVLEQCPYPSKDTNLHEI